MNRKKPASKNLFRQAKELIEKKTGKGFINYLASELPDAANKAEKYEKEGIKDVVIIRGKDWKTLIKTGVLKERGRGLIGHPRLGATNIGDIVAVIGYDDSEKKIEKRARVVSMTHPYKKEHRVDWEIELIKE